MATLVLLHGAWSGGWLWEPAAKVLRAAGHEVHRPTFTGLGERAHLARPEIDLQTHVQDVLGVLEAEDLHQVVLVAFSYGGMVAEMVAERALARVARLIYVDAFLPENEKSMFDFMPPQVRAAMEAQVQTAGEGWRLPPRPLDGLGRIAPYAQPEADILQRLASRMPQPARTFSQPATLQGSAAVLPHGYIYATDKAPNDPMALFARRAREAGWRYAEIPTGHFPVLTMPRELAALILEFAR
jgi:pimeloyl-ACP methyl ester carboxylesterase